MFNNCTIAKKISRHSSKLLLKVPCTYNMHMLTDYLKTLILSGYIFFVVEPQSNYIKIIVIFVYISVNTTGYWDTYATIRIHAVVFSS